MRRYFLAAITARFSGLDWGLLVGMVAVTQNRFFVGKLIGVLLLAVVTPALKWLHKPGFQRFYLSMVAWTVLQWAVVVRDYSSAYSFTAAYAAGYWLLMAIVAAALRGSVEEVAGVKSRKTIDAVFAVVAALSVMTLVSTSIQAGAFNPFENAPEPLFGMSSGDHVTGLFGFHLFHAELGDYSIVNGAVLALFTIFYAGAARWRLAVVALVLMLFTVSNFLTLVTLAAVGVWAVVRWRRKYFLAAFASLAITLLFYAIVTPKNLRYAATELSSKAAQVLPRDTSRQHTERLTQRHPRVEQATVVQKRRAGFDPDAESGKIRAFKQTAAMLDRDALHLLAGAGPGRYSSVVATLAAAPPSEKGRMHAPLRFQSREFRNGHGRIMVAVKLMNPSYHTVSQMPNSWYNQIAGEYGVVGVVLFLGLYILCALRARRGATGIASLFALLLIVVADYTFEGLTIVPFFEWMLWTSRPVRRNRATVISTEASPLHQN